MGRLIKLSVFIFVFNCPSIYGQHWQQLNTANEITARANSSAIFLDSTNEIIIFGGKTTMGNTNDIWALNLESLVWREIIPQSNISPNPRHTQNALFDEERNRMIIWGGQGGGLLNDIWAFDFEENIWINISINGNTDGFPLQRYGTSSIYDTVTDNLITFAGFTTSGRFDDTWQFNFESESWEEKNIVLFPQKRCLFNGCFVPAQRKMIIYGGQSNGNLGDIWQLDVDDFIWSDITPSISPPSRHFASLVYDGIDNLILFGGNSSNQNNFSGGLNDLWQFSLSTQTWDTLPQGSIMPSPRVGHMAVFINDRNKMILFGGRDTSSEFNNEIWEYSLDPSTDVLDIKDNEESFQVDISPNPTFDFIDATFEIYENEKVSIKVMNLLGEEMHTVPDLNELANGIHLLKIDLSFLSQGIYFITIQKDQDQPFVGKIIKK